MAAFDHHSAFLAHQPIPGVTFEHNDYVVVVTGEHAGNKGSLVNVYQLAPDPVYTLELESGHDVLVLQSEIERHGF